MPKFEVRFSTVAEFTAVVEAEDEIDAEDLGAEYVENFLDTYFPGPVRMDASIDGIGPDSVEEARD
jgi:hypothetical protein